MNASSIRALLFDVFGTCVDWRTGVMRDVAALASAKGRAIDAAAFADAWRARYQPAMEAVRSGARPWVDLDTLHRESLAALLAPFGLGDLSAAEIDVLNRTWHRLDPWPDVVGGLARLKRRFVIAPLSNGHVALLLAMAKRAGLPWDTIVSAETSRAYKPQPGAYLGAVELLRLAPAQAMMVAAHNADLEAAASLGLATAFVRRPREHGPAQSTDLAPSRAWDVVADDFGGLADALAT